MDKKRPFFLQGFDSNFIPFNVEGRNGATLADKFGANEGNNFQMTRPATLWGIHVHEMPNFCTQTRTRLTCYRYCCWWWWWGWWWWWWWWCCCCCCGCGGCCCCCYRRFAAVLYFWNRAVLSPDHASLLTCVVWFADMMIGPQSLNPVTNVTLLCEEQAKYIANLVVRMQEQQARECEPSAEAVREIFP